MRAHRVLGRKATQERQTSSKAVIVIAVLGAELLYFALTSSRSFVDQASQTFTGRFTQQTMVQIMLGITALVAGAFTAISSRR